MLAAMKFNRKSNRLWISECGNYRIAATGIVPGMTYSASYQRNDSSYEQLGIFMKGTAQQNAEGAKTACSDHAETLATNDREAGQG